MTMSARGGSTTVDARAGGRLPPGLAWVARSLLLTGLAFALAALPVDAGCNLWNHQTYPTWSGLLGVTLGSLYFYRVIPLMLWFWTGFFGSAFSALRPKGIKPSLLVFPLSAPLLASWALLLLRFRPQNPPPVPLYGYPVFAIGCTLMFLSTAPGFWCRVPRRWLPAVSAVTIAVFAVLAVLALVIWEFRERLFFSL